ncbi:MAG: efflux RND transporter periplasmic adaptor subunit [Pseudomonadales bacterium]|nr:efflux RND transporter periplasmic adaptor subunit [Pseudomonadales bacterium]
MRLAVPLLLWLPCLAACSHPKPIALPPQAVETQIVAPQASSDILDLAGAIHARVDTSLGFQVPGRIMARSINLGSHVDKGQILAEIDSRDLNLAVEAAQAEMHAAQSDLELAKTDFKRAEDLTGKGFVSTAERDHRQVALDAAQAHYEQAKSQLDLRNNQLNYATLRAPASGVVTQVNADRGQVVAAGEPVFRLAEDGARDVEVVLPEDKLPLIHATHATVSLWATPGQVLPATLREVSASADPITRTYTLRYALQAGKFPLVLGQSAVLHLYLNHPLKQLLIPTTALFERSGLTMVWIYQPTSKSLQARQIHVLGAQGNEVAVAGLKAGETIITAGVHVLVDGESVMPLPAAYR